LEGARAPLAKVVYPQPSWAANWSASQRIQLLAGHIARALGGDPALLNAQHGGEGRLDHRHGRRVPGAAGHDGRYYALHDGEPKEVADAIERTTGRDSPAIAFPKDRLHARLRSRTSSTR
jgi:glycyl-tRNA synthetase beta subunit